MKTRSGSSAGRGEEAVDARKRARLVRGAAAWLRANAPQARRVRFDVIACIRNEATDEWQIQHWPGAFDAAG